MVALTDLFFPMLAQFPGHWSLIPYPLSPLFNGAL
jgi:hypothetical protein